ncbi:hypothetical protein [Novipirellula sp.]|uniref:hypothetical protein n=1 Tax=Novipirellula sp. TaxID=2795430 RepID=UPI003561AC9C
MRLLLSLVLNCFAGVAVHAKDPVAPVMVVSDTTKANLLPPLPPATPLVVLIQSGDETYDDINARAMTIRMNPSRLWWAAASGCEWPDDEESIAEIRLQWGC